MDEDPWETAMAMRHTPVVRDGMTPASVVEDLPQWWRDAVDGQDMIVNAEVNYSHGYIVLSTAKGGTGAEWDDLYVWRQKFEYSAHPTRTIELIFERSGPTAFIEAMFVIARDAYAESEMVEFIDPAKLDAVQEAIRTATPD